ncbi:hypothetical protein TNCV_2101471 [Trichonephila clavipes]|nr:hypothetical protein TNCV_2101471 [Trichonephila clavipes]
MQTVDKLGINLQSWWMSYRCNAYQLVSWIQRRLQTSTHEHHLRKKYLIITLVKKVLENDEAHFWLNGYVNKQNCRIWSEANPQVYVKTPLHPEKLIAWCALWAGGILLQKR